MMDVTEALLESWDRQNRMVNDMASLVNESNRKAKPSEDGWALDHQLAHVHKVRHYFLGQVAPDLAATVADSFQDGWETPITDLDAIKAALVSSGQAVRDAVDNAIASGSELKGYDHPVLFLQHMVWHEGWHVGLIFLALRLAGQGPSQEWEEAQIWDQWRTEIY